MTLFAVVAWTTLAAGPPPPPLAVGTLSGRVTAADGTPLPDTRIEVVEVHRSTTSGPDGRYRITQLPSGTYSVTFALIGYAPAVRRITVREGDVTLDVALARSIVEIPAIQVTASPLATDALSSPQPLAALADEELRAAVRPSLGETLEQLPGLRNLSTGSGIGKPVIRGLTSNRVLIVADGQRLETAQWGDEHGPNVETADAARVEVIRGPASVLYGSDALGGVINVVPRSLPDATGGTGFVRGGFNASFSSNQRQPDGTLMLEGASPGGTGFRLALGGRTGSDIRTPTGELANSGHETYGGSGTIGVRGGWGALTLNYVHREERVEIHEDPDEEPNFTGYQRIGEDRGRATLSAPVGGSSRLEVVAGYERNRRREFEETGTDQVALGLLSKTWTGDVHLHHAAFGRFAGIVGVSGVLNSFDKFGEETLIPNSDARNLGAYLFEQAEVGRWNLSFGVRYDWRRLEVEDDADLGVAAQSRTWNSVTGNLGVLFKLAEPAALVLNLGRGFRAPSSFDLFANGVHEGTVAFERGNPNLVNETSFNTDLALRIQASRARVEIGGFLNLVDDYIYTRPTGTFDPVSGFEIFDVVQGDARLTGVEASVDLHATDRLHLRTGMDFTHGTNTTTDTPLAFVAPFRWIYSARFEGAEGAGAFRRPWLQLGGETNAEQTRIDPSDLAPAGYTLVHAGAGVTLALGGQELTLDLGVRNLFDKTYRAFLSRYKRYADNAGRDVTLRASMGW